jgi:hypothetical protein
MSSNNQRSEEIVAVLRQALEALEQDVRLNGGWKSLGEHKAITFIRQVIKELKEKSYD